MTRFALCVALAMCACGGEEATTDHELPAAARVTGTAPEAATAPAIVLEVATTEQDLDAGRFGGSFPIDTVDDLLARVRFGDAAPAGDHVRLEVYAPGGGLLTVYGDTISGGAVLFVVPVAATPIERWSLTGSFGLVATVEELPQLTASAAIELTEEQP